MVITNETKDVFQMVLDSNQNRYFNLSTTQCHSPAATNIPFPTVTKKVHGKKCSRNPTKFLYEISLLSN
jgi:hypothetical protein